MEIIEQFIFGKKGNLTECEDGMVITDKLIAVVDGATSKSTKKFENAASGAFARKIICDVLNEPGIEKITCEELFSKLTGSIKENSDRCFENLEYTEYPRASVIIYNSYYNEIWSYGDCQCIINGQLHTHEKLVDVLNSELRAFHLEHALLNGYEIRDFAADDVGRKNILENFKKQYAFENKNGPFGYSVLNGSPINADMIVRYTVNKGDEIVLSSDGYPFLKTTLAESEAGLREVLENDPMCFRIYKTTKGIAEGNLSFDDRCYCRFKV